MSFYVGCADCLESQAGICRYCYEEQCQEQDDHDFNCEGCEQEISIMDFEVRGGLCELCYQEMLAENS